MQRNESRLRAAKHVWNLRKGVSSFDSFEHHFRCYQFASSMAKHLKGEAFYTTRTSDLEKETKLVIDGEDELQKYEKDARRRFNGSNAISV